MTAEVRKSSVDGNCRRARLLQIAMKCLDESGISVCILHGYQQFDTGISSDVDCLIDPRVSVATVVKVLAGAGIRLVQAIQHEATAYYLVFVDGANLNAPDFLILDMSTDFRREGRVFYTAEEILDTKQRCGSYWVPEAANEFGYYLVKKIAKGQITEDQGRRLSDLYSVDPSGCLAQMKRFWPDSSVAILSKAASATSWTDVKSNMKQLRADLFPKPGFAHLRDAARYWIPDARRRAKRVLRPTGLQLVLLGADGSGKTTVVGKVSQSVAPAFRRTATNHFAPGLLRQRSRQSSASVPHARPPRSLPSSVLKCAYWFADFSIGYHVKVRPRLVRSTFVVFDRYLLDVLVDHKRYRYGGPDWLLRAVWRLVSKPDLIVLLDAPAEVLQERKQEVSKDESARQREAYRSLVSSLGSGRIVDAGQSLDSVVADVNSAIIDFLSNRSMRELGQIPA